MGLPVLFIPGNHDVGNRAGLEDAVTEQRMDRWMRVFDEDRFSTHCGAWSLIGIDTQIMGSGFDLERRQWQWLDEQLHQSQLDDQSVALFLHTPPFLQQADEFYDGPSDYWTVEREARRALLERLDHRQVKLIVNGHAHWHWIGRYGKATWIWAPPLSPLIVNDSNYPRLDGSAQFAGAMILSLTEQGASHQALQLDLNPRTIPWPVPASD